ncbi:MAG TPA: Ni/Fe-hydrogenase, b-type cytochrome subunit [Deltaproteobacteria bacterium]|nr:Ni/Fe-hydrogenase, b-type cytochrome subunit [Deltaproteobacteria bacterium]HOM29881.1 Ni/Fe-hydrogenase, b-type cytochrome subunit [Deltaproteobacteria bacterium]HPP80415.1 Ni/Fe-hydrogenase, b-type cytochrome subunit [Deltaproteobacteria bacterium]
MDTRTAKKEWSLSLRANHWIMALCIFGLIATGFYIARPITFSAGETIDKFAMGYARYFHLMFGVTLTFLFVWRVYLMFFSRFHADWKDFFAWTDFRNFWTQIKFYTFLSQKKPEHTHLYGPLQSIAYGGFFAMLLVLIVTGLILAGVDYSSGFIGTAYAVFNPITNAIGGLAVVRVVHHVFTWLVILFVVVHVYMAFWYDMVFKEGTISSMIGGRIFRKQHE